ncbi:MAG: lysine--tRNA ligase [Acidimicrobiales bacterium]
MTEDPSSQPPYRYERTASAASLHAQFSELAASEETEVYHGVAGRAMLVRSQGKVAFATLADSSGQIQLFARATDTSRFKEFTRLSLGDWIGATGKVMKTRRGELSILVKDWVMLAEARLPFGDKWRGITDIEIRYRQREVELWANELTREVLQSRSAIISETRKMLEGEGFVEVETPMLHPIAGGALAKPFMTHHNALDMDLYLRIAPELYLKRLVVGGFEKVFEIGRVFRNEGISPRHNPEFTILELYQAYADYEDLMVSIESLVAALARKLLGTARITYQGREVDLDPPWRRATLEELVEESTGCAFTTDTPVAVLTEFLRELGGAPESDWGSGKLLMEIYEKACEAHLWGPVIVKDFPVEVSPLARRHRHNPALVERFEVVIAGRELANAFSELVDPDDQRSRFEAQARQHARGDDEAMTVDEDYIHALEHGLPPTAGLGMGMDRLVMLLTDQPNIRDVIAFPTLRPKS